MRKSNVLLSGLVWKQLKWSQSRKENAKKSRRRVEHLETELKKPYIQLKPLETQQSVAPITSKQEVVKKVFQSQFGKNSISDLEVVDQFFKQRLSEQKTKME